MVSLPFLRVPEPVTHAALASTPGPGTVPSTHMHCRTTHFLHRPQVREGIPFTEATPIMPLCKTSLQRFPICQLPYHLPHIL